MRLDGRKWPVPLLKETMDLLEVGCVVWWVFFFFWLVGQQVGVGIGWFVGWLAGWLVGGWWVG